MKGMINLLKNEHNVNENTPMTPELIAEYFKTPDEYKYVNMVLPKHALLPTNKYYEKYADHMRLLTNEHTTSDTNIRRGYDFEVQAELREQGIDIRDTGLTPQIIRDSLWNKHFAERAALHAKEVQGLFLDDEVFTERYYSEVAQHIDSLSTESEPWSANHKDYYELINTKIYQCFCNAVNRNIEYMKEKNKWIHKLKKRDFFLKLQKFFLESRLIKSSKAEEFINGLRLTELSRESVNSKVFDKSRNNHGMDDTLFHPLNAKKNLKQIIDLDQDMFQMRLQERWMNFEKEAKFKRLMLQTNNDDPVQYTKHYDWLVKLKEFRYKFEQAQNKRIQERLIRHEEAAAKAEADSNFDRDNQLKMLDLVTDEQLASNEFNDEKLSKVKNLQDLMDVVINSSNDLKFLLSSNGDGKESHLAKNFKDSFKQLLNKLLQIALLNVIEESDGKQGLSFMKVDKADSLEMFDRVLEEKVNVRVIRGLVESVKPALVAHLKNVLEDEAVKILYSLDHQENINGALIHLIAAEKSAHTIDNQEILKEFLKDEEVRNDPEIKELLKQRPVNFYETKGMSDQTTLKEAKEKHKTLIHEDPFEALRVISTAQVLYNYDVTGGNIEKKKAIHNRIKKNFSNLKDPVKDLAEYGMTLTLAHQLVKAQDNQEAEGYYTNHFLLSKSEGTSDEVANLLAPLRESMIKKANQDFSTRKEIAELLDNSMKSSSSLSDYLNSFCDVNSLQALKEQAVNAEGNPDLLKVIEHINTNLEFTPNQRRKKITIKDYLKNDTKLDLSFINKIADSVLFDKAKTVAEKMLVHKEGRAQIEESDLLSDDVKKSIADQLQLQQKKVFDKNTLQPYQYAKDKEVQISEGLRQDIEKAVKMSPTLEHTRCKLENNLLELMITSTNNQEDINNMIQEWIELRVVDMKMKPEYKVLSNSEYQNILNDRFKEAVMTELGLNDSETDLKNYKAFNPLSELDKDAYSNDVSNKNNLNHRMKDTVGYDNLANGGTQNYFEKLLAKYYLDKRKDYAASKEMLDKLDQEFTRRTLGYDSMTPDQMTIGYDLEKAIKDAENRGVKLGLSQFYNNNLRSQHVEAEMHEEDTQKMMKLGDNTHVAIYGRNNGIAEELLKYDSEFNTWPEMLPKFDPKRSPKQWVEEKLDEICKEIFDARSKIETNMSRNELKAFDEHLAHHFNKDKMIVRLFDKLDEEYVELNRKRAQHQGEENTKMDADFKKKKHPNIQRDFNRSLKNEDAAYKLIAYRYSRDNDPSLPPTAFIHFYDQQLQRDFEMPKRPVNELDYMTNSEKNENYYHQVTSKRVMNPPDKEQQYHDDYAKITEGALEDIERQEAYYILEQYKKREDLDGKAQKALKDYFSKYENISFFEINKIK